MAVISCLYKEGAQKLADADYEGFKVTTDEESRIFHSGEPLQDLREARDWARTQEATVLFSSSVDHFRMDVKDVDWPQISAANRAMLRQAKELRDLADDLERAAIAPRPPAEKMAAQIAAYLRYETKSIGQKLDNNHIKTGNGYKGALQQLQRELNNLASDIERWLNEGLEPWWAEERPKKKKG